MRVFRSVKTKIAAVVLFVMAALAVLLLVVNLGVSERYKALQTTVCQSTVDAESQRVNEIISAMENNVRKLALIGQLLAKSPDGPAALGQAAVEQSFPEEAVAVGGGIFYAPFLFGPEQERVCFYAFREDDGTVVFDPSFESEAYDYPTQSWYTTIRQGALANEGEQVWTSPYFDDAGTNALMTTVGSGIFLDGAFAGVATGDWVLTDIAASIAAIKPTEGSHALFGDLQSGMVLAYSGAEAVAHELSLSDFPWLEEALATGHAQVDGTRCLVFSNILSNRMTIVSIVPEAELFAEINQANRSMWLIMGIFSLVIVLITTFLLGRFINRPVTALNASVGQIAAGDLTARIFLHTGDEFQTLADSVNVMAQELSDYLENLTQITAEKERIGAELNVATKIQASMLPSIFPAFPEREEFDIHALMQPAKEVGGDFYDFFLIDENTLAVVMADVSGKGVPAALFMVIAKTLIKNNAQYNKSPKDVFETVNNLLCEGNDSAMFVTAFMGYLDIPTGRFTFVNAGHNLPLIRRAGEGYGWLKTPKGFVLAGMEDTAYREGEVLLSPGDELFLYTDGVTEAVNREKKLFSDPRLLETANGLLDMPLWSFTASMKREIERFADGAEQADDITMLLLKYKGECT